MNCSTCGLPLSRTRCGANSKLVCRRGHRQPPDLQTVHQTAPDWAWAEWVQAQGIGE